MGTNALSELVKDVRTGEDGDAAYERLCGHQIKACDFRRWYAQVKLNGPLIEADTATATKLGEYIAEGMTVEESFAEHCPDYVSPGVFGVAYEREMKSRTSAPAFAAPPVKSKGSSKPPALVSIPDGESDVSGS